MLDPKDVAVQTEDISAEIPTSTGSTLEKKDDFVDLVNQVFNDLNKEEPTASGSCTTPVTDDLQKLSGVDTDSEAASTSNIEKLSPNR